MCAAVEPADDAAAALHEQKIVASHEADAACRRRSLEADATVTLRCVWSGLCAARCLMCVGQAAAHVLFLVASEMSELQRCPGDVAFGVSMVYTYRPPLTRIASRRQREREQHVCVDIFVGVSYTSVRMRFIKQIYT